MRVAVPKENVEDASEPATVRFSCPSCGRKFVTKADLAGKKIRCNGCGAGVRVPQAEGSPIAQASQPTLASSASTDQARAAVRPGPGVKGGNGAPSEADDDSGYAIEPLEQISSTEVEKLPKPQEAILPSRSEAMAQVRKEVAEQEATETQQQAQKAKKRKKKKKKKSGYFNPKDTLILAGCLGGFVAVLAVLAWRFPDFRFPLGALLCVIGFIVYLLGLAALRQLVAEEGAFKLLLFRFFPPYQIWFVATHWVETKDYVVFFLSGLLILSIGGAVLKIAPLDKKERESIRAYEKAQQRAESEAPPTLLPVTAEDNE
jgi:hypothetical protein